MNAKYFLGQDIRSRQPIDELRTPEFLFKKISETECEYIAIKIKDKWEKRAPTVYPTEDLKKSIKFTEIDEKDIFLELL